MKKYFFLSFLFFLTFSLASLAQEDSISTPKEEKAQIIPSKKIKVDSLPHYPSKAALYSTILPGLGQAYNKKYWKIPIIYGLGGTLGYFIGFNNNRYLEFKASFEAKLDGRPEDDPRPFLSETAAQRNRDYFKRNRELLVILTILLHGLNIVDATVDAHLKSFDVGDDLAIKLEPNLEQVGPGAFAGFSLKFILK